MCIRDRNKLQQDSLLKALEEGVIKFIGSTTENPYFSVNNAIISRVRNIYEFKRLTSDEVVVILKRTLSDDEKMCIRDRCGAALAGEKSTHGKG